jgi:hypothetical protein
MNFTPIFIGGGWRSGTSVLHALVCTSPRTNQYISEVNYFSALFNVFAQADAAFQFHNKFYFRDREQMLEVHGKTLRRELKRTWEYLGSPEILALKSPPMTVGFPLLGKMVPAARFIVAVRDPRDVVSSRLDVVRKLQGNADVEQTVRAECAEYKRQYEGLLAGDLGDRLCVVEYEKLVAGDVSSLKRFGLSDIDQARLWETELKFGAKAGGGPYITKLYGKPLSDSSVGRYRQVLDKPTQDLVMSLCGELCERVRAHSRAPVTDGAQPGKDRVAPAPAASQ